ncbi:MAG TPA: DUF2892 domain-containing protein [Dissulfurispiraceae bacterium]|nr:DUF2892 domain-containing protein [Dissulfurispiraceae bacterium]
MYRANTDSWYLERVIWLIAGIFTLASALLTLFHSTYWLILTVLVGVNLIIFGVTGFCVMANILYALGLRPKIRKDEDSERPGMVR